MRKTYNADTFDGEYHSREEPRQLLGRREQLDTVERPHVAEDVVECDREAAYHEDVRQHREWNHVLEIAHLAEQYQCRNQRQNVHPYAHVRAGAEIRYLRRSDRNEAR